MAGEGAALRRRDTAGLRRSFLDGEQCFAAAELTQNGRPHYKEIQFSAPIVLSVVFGGHEAVFSRRKGKIFCSIADSCLPW
jgi:hypothetical protein